MRLKSKVMVLGMLNEESCSDTEQSQIPGTEREDSFILEGKQQTLHEKGERRASIGITMYL